MKKQKNIFLFTVLAIIALIIIFQIIFSFAGSRDTNSYVTLTKGQGVLNEEELIIDQKTLLEVGDRIENTGKESLSIIQWGDGSLTRLGGDSSIEVQDTRVSSDKTKFQIAFTLLRGKSWSQVISFVGNDSSFTQSFEGVEAGVRGTVFDVDLEKDFIHVSDHAVILRDDEGNTLELGEGNTLDLETVSFVDIKEFLKELQDRAWVSVNKELDEQNIEELREVLLTNLEDTGILAMIRNLFIPESQLFAILSKAEKFSEVEDYISTLDRPKKTKIYTGVLSRYQEMNFVKSTDKEFYKKKLFYKKALILLAPSEGEKDALLQSVSYDLEDTLKTKGIDAWNQTLSIIGEKQKLLENIDTTFLEKNIFTLPEGLRNEFTQQIQGLEESLGITLPEKIDSETVGNALDSADSAIQNFLDENAGGLLDLLQN